ncbi:MAG: hypothetical protein WC966_03945 [Bradymonadales bacterium]|jgi:hypothetical protein
MRKLYCVLAVVGTSLLLQSCFFESDCYNEVYEQCVTRCDAFYCWDECERVEVCVSNSHGYTQCTRNSDCGYGRVCNNGQCYDRYTPNHPTVPMCGACTDSQQCSEAHAACTIINQQTGEQVCTRSCTLTSDCPQNFVCESVGASSYQCIPKSLSCSNVSQYCERTDQCFAGEVCQNNLCVRGQSVECTNNLDCGNPDKFVCLNNKCSRYCYDDFECPATEACFYTSREFYNSGVCMPSNHLQCRYSAECFESSFICTNGRCKKSCTDNQDCSNDYTSSYVCISGYCQIPAY